MKRFHVHVAVEDLQDSIRFYSTLFGVNPSVARTDYAKWMLDDPRVNFAISQRGHTPGINHLGLQVESDAELKDMRTRLDAADTLGVEETGTACCYARSDKYWVTDPTGIAWETFHTLGSIPVFGEDRQSADSSAACCIPIETDAQDSAAACCVSSQDAPNEVPKAACCP